MSRRTRYLAVHLPALAALICLGLSSSALAEERAGPVSPESQFHLKPGNLLVSTSTFQNDPNIIVGTPLPPGCGTTVYNSPCGLAIVNGDYPFVFNNDTVDGHFGITSKIVLQQLDTSGKMLGTLEVPNSSRRDSASSDNQMVTSFSSKSELGLNLSPDGKFVTFMGYDAPIDATDVSNGNTPGVIDPTNADGAVNYRVVAELGKDGKFKFTLTNAYSGDNGRAAIANDENGSDLIYTAGNAGGGANPEPEGVVLGAGAQLVHASDLPEALQNPGQPTPLASFNVMQQLGYPKEKIAKDDNFRSVTIHNNVVYYAKGSGGNGVDTVYFVDTTDSCPGGSGLPAAGALLPATSSLTYSANLGGAGNPGLTPQNLCILKGFPTASAKNANNSTGYPFGIWFAGDDTIYVADEGSGDNTFGNGVYGAAAASTTAGLQKWVFNSSTGSWKLAYTLQAGLHLGTRYSVPGYPTGINDGPGGTGLPWAPATAGLRNLTGRVNHDGTVTLWAVTSTVSGSGDQGADPDKLVSITDRLAASTLPASEHFETIETAPAGSLFRGISFTPGTTGR